MVLAKQTVTVLGSLYPTWLGFFATEVSVFKLRYCGICDWAGDFRRRQAIRRICYGVTDPTRPAWDTVNCVLVPMLAKCEVIWEQNVIGVLRKVHVRLIYTQLLPPAGQEQKLCHFFCHSRFTSHSYSHHYKVFELQESRRRGLGFTASLSAKPFVSVDLMGGKRIRSLSLHLSAHTVLISSLKCSSNSQAMNVLTCILYVAFPILLSFCDTLYMLACQIWYVFNAANPGSFKNKQLETLFSLE